MFVSHFKKNHYISSPDGIGTEWSSGYYGFSFGVTPIGGAVGTGMTSRSYWFW